MRYPHPTPREETVFRGRASQVGKQFATRAPGPDGERAERAMTWVAVIAPTITDELHAMLVKRVDDLEGCPAGSDEERELAAIERAIGAYEAVRWPTGKIAGDGWLHEVKFDGYRVQAHKIGSRVVLYSRNGMTSPSAFLP